MTKLIIQIPCYNEEKTLPVTLADLPRSLPGVDEIEWLIIDDGSIDNTVEVARAHGVDHIARHITNLGLARAFMTGIETCLQLGADIIVNTDADNQYCAADIPKLIEPILSGKAEIVVGTRAIETIAHFSFVKKVLQKFGSWVVRQVSRTNIADAPSGFRGFSRAAAMQLHVFNNYTYTLETIIQAGQKGIAITSVPIRTNEKLRPSRLISSIPAYINRSLLTIVRIFMTYQPFSFFTTPGIISFALGFLLGLRFLYFFLIGDGTGHIQSLILTALLMILGGFLVTIGLVADLVSVNRQLLEKVDWRLQKLIERDREDNNG